VPRARAARKANSQIGLERDLRRILHEGQVRSVRVLGVLPSRRDTKPSLRLTIHQMFYSSMIAINP
jgi:hypothetical protein